MILSTHLVQATTQWNKIHQSNLATKATYHIAFGCINQMHQLSTQIPTKQLSTQSNLAHEATK